MSYWKKKEVIKDKYGRTVNREMFKDIIRALKFKSGKDGICQVVLAMGKRGSIHSFMKVLQGHVPDAKSRVLYCEALEMPENVLFPLIEKEEEEAS